MNRLRYRVIFNRVRGLPMAVQENTSSGASTGSTPATRPTAGSIVDALLFAATAAVASACALLCAGLAQAQIVADPSAPGRQQPTVLVAPNGVPLVNIQTPSAAGVSRNTYSQMDVAPAGAILNNSRTNVQTQLGGWVQGNPWLARGSARVIVNEVNSAQPSRLRGAIEVAGPRTEVVIANPAGIAVDGGGFINASRVTLTTGAPVFNAGNLEAFRVQRGTVRIDGLGLDAGSADYAAILARAVEVNAGIWARQLRVAAGAHQASADGGSATPLPGTGPAPAFALDVAAIGGMYAGHIFLVGTEAGLGMRNAGTRSVSLTDDGAQFYAGVVKWQADFEDIQGSLSLGDTDLRGTIRIEMPVTYGRLLFMPFLATFLQRHPRLRVEVRMSDGHVDLVAEGVDLAIRIGDMADSDLVVRPLGTVRMGTYMRVDCMRAFGTPAHPHDLASHRLISFVHPSGRARKMQYLQDGVGIDIDASHAVASFNNGEAMTDAVIAGIGIAQLPSFHAGPALAAGTLAQVLQGWDAPGAAIQLVYPSRRHLSRRVRAMIDAIGSELTAGMNW